MIFFIISCDEPPSENQNVEGEKPLPPPKNVRVKVDDELWVYYLRWDSVPEATYYIVSWTDGVSYYEGYDTSFLDRFFQMDRSKTYSFSVKAAIWTAADSQYRISVPSDIVTIQGAPGFPQLPVSIIDSSGPSGPGYDKVITRYEGQWSVYDPAVHAGEKAAWEALGIRSYRYTVTMFGSRGDSPRYFTVTVYPEKTPEIICNTEGIYDDFFVRYFMARRNAIDEFFDYIQDDSGNFCTYYIVYNAEYHYPEFYKQTLSPPEKIIGLGPTYFYIHSFEVLEE